MRLRLAWYGVGVIAALVGCGGDDEPGDSFGALSRDAVLGELDGDGARALCDATEALRDDYHTTEEGHRAACFLEITGDVRIGLINLENNPDRYSLDQIVADCEDALERCLDEGAAPRPCRSLTFNNGCRATVADYARCAEGSIAATAAFSRIDCEGYARSEDVRDEVNDAALMGLRACTQELVDCEAEVDPPESEEPSWSDGGFGVVEPDAGAFDDASNAEWVEHLEQQVQALERPDCDAALERTSELDEAAAMLAARPLGSEIDLGLDTAAQWKWVMATSLEQVAERVQVFLEETASACTWVGYGLAVAGEPGESRQVVVLLAE